VMKRPLDVGTKALDHAGSWTQFDHNEYSSQEYARRVSRKSQRGLVRVSHVRNRTRKQPDTRCM
jgi:hypothetical protein